MDGFHPTKVGLSKNTTLVGSVELQDQTSMVFWVRPQKLQSYESFWDGNSNERECLWKRHKASQL